MQELKLSLTIDKLEYDFVNNRPIGSVDFNTIKPYINLRHLIVKSFNFTNISEVLDIFKNLESLEFYCDIDDHDEKIVVNLPNVKTLKGNFTSITDNIFTLHGVKFIVSEKIEVIECAAENISINNTFPNLRKLDILSDATCEIRAHVVCDETLSFFRFGRAMMDATARLTGSLSADVIILDTIDKIDGEFKYKLMQQVNDTITIDGIEYKRNEEEHFISASGVECLRLEVDLYVVLTEVPSVHDFGDRGYTSLCYVPMYDRLELSDIVGTNFVTKEFESLEYDENDITFSNKYKLTV